jgi:hypothetical protein
MSQHYKEQEKNRQIRLSIEPVKDSFKQLRSQLLQTGDAPPTHIGPYERPRATQNTFESMVVTPLLQIHAIPSASDPAQLFTAAPPLTVPMPRPGRVNMSVDRRARSFVTCGSCGHFKFAGFYRQYHLQPGCTTPQQYRATRFYHGWCDCEKCKQILPDEPPKKRARNIILPATSVLPGTQLPSSTASTRPPAAQFANSLSGFSCKLTKRPVSALNPDGDSEQVLTYICPQGHSLTVSFHYR